MVEVDYDTVRGACGDERYRIGLLSGEEIVEPRPSVFGGPNIYGLYVAELAGVFANSPLSADERLVQVTRDLNRNKRDGATIDQTKVHHHSDGEDSFEHDDAYAREAVLVGVALSVPNPELHQIDVR